MLQAVTPKHDAHHVRTESTSLASLTASLGDGKVHILLAASGSVATIKLPLIIQALASSSSSRRRQGGAGVGGEGGEGRAAAPAVSIRVVLTQSAAHFLAGQSAEQPTLSSLASMPCVDAVYSDADEWGPRPWKRGGGILHIELRRWADILVIAPLSANTLAKIVNGMCDNLLTSVVRAWDPDGAADGAAAAAEQRRRKKRIVVAPAMNTAMWRHPITAKQIRTLEKEWGVGAEDEGEGRPVNANGGAGADAPAAGLGGAASVGGGGWFEVLPPQEKLLACGDVGVGGMADWNEIVRVIELRLGRA